MSLPSAPGTCGSCPPGAEALGQQLRVEAVVQVPVNLLGLLRADLGGGGDGLRGAARDSGDTASGGREQRDRQEPLPRPLPGVLGLRAQQQAQERERKCRAGGSGDAQGPRSLI